MSTEQNTAAAPSTNLRDGLGTIGFNVDERKSCFGQMKRGDQVVEVRGTYTDVGATLEGDLGGGKRLVVNLTKGKQNAAGTAPAMRGTRLWQDTGEVEACVLWRPKTGSAYGMDLDTPFEKGETGLPF